MSTNYVFFVAVFLLFNIATFCVVGELISCGETSWARKTLVTKSRNPPEVCEYHLKVYSPRIRQLFIEFSTVLAPPIYKNGALQCARDYLEILGMRYCGTLHGQRMFFPFNATQGVEEITLTVKLTSRFGPTGILVVPYKPNWNIKVHQLEEAPESELLKREWDWPSCGEISRARDTLITSFRKSPEVCEYHLKVYSPRVKELVIEFSTVLAPPIYKNRTLECVLDYLEIAGMRYCGTLDDQRMFFPFNATQGLEEITLTVKLASRFGPTGILIVPYKPNWNIKIHQWEEATASELLKRELDRPSCGDTLWAKETVVTSFPNTPEVCEYHLKAYSPRVRKLFIEFSTALTPPIYKNGTLECVHDYLEITNLRFCGTQDKRLLSVTFNATQGVEQITLTVRLVSRFGPTGEDVMPYEPTWTITIDQWEEASSASSTAKCQLTKIVGITPN